MTLELHGMEILSLFMATAKVIASEFMPVLIPCFSCILVAWVPYMRLARAPAQETSTIAHALGWQPVSSSSINHQVGIP